MEMFCFQCQETARNTGCTIKGVCGKTAEVATMQDLLMFVTKGLAFYSVVLREKGIYSNEIDKLIVENLFVTITNANFDLEAIKSKVDKSIAKRNSLRKTCNEHGVELKNVPDYATWEPADESDYLAKGAKVGVLRTENEDVRSLRELLTYGLKGMAAYTEHAYNLNFEDEKIYRFIQESLLATDNSNLSADELVALVLECGKFGVEAMALLDKANTSTYGHPEITKVNIGVRKNPGILISGHDLRDMEDLLKQTEGTGVDVYTHSEMLPANYYPKFKKYEHFVGNYGSSWWHQKEDFETFNGPILFTTNCIVPPSSKSTYSDRVYTTGASGFPGFKHIGPRSEGGMKDFSEIINHAKKCNPPTEIETGEIVGGFAHNQVISLADKVVEAVKTGAITKFVVMGGCDGRNKDRDYYTEFAKALPESAVILTAGCAKYRYNKLPLGDINGIPRVLDAGQCNDSYSLAVIALKLKEVFGLDDVNELPIAYNIAWYEQKAVIVLLALLYLGIKNIHLGPTIPAFLSPNVTNVLVEKFGISPIDEVDKDIKKLIG